MCVHLCLYLKLLIINISHLSDCATTHIMSAYRGFQLSVKRRYSQASDTQICLDQFLPTSAMSPSVVLLKVYVAFPTSPGLWAFLLIQYKDVYFFCI